MDFGLGLGLGKTLVWEKNNIKAEWFNIIRPNNIWSVPVLHYAADIIGIELDVLDTKIGKHMITQYMV